MYIIININLQHVSGIINSHAGRRVGRGPPLRRLRSAPGRMGYYILYVMCYMLYVICYMSYVICYVLYVICYMLYVIHTRIHYCISLYYII